ncbi:MAG: thioredoxin [Bacteroidales bacterium]|jgi:thioredoxin|nr:thioredoxin [Bacteroidales bacterium]
MAELLTKDTFKEKIFDFENEKEWLFKGERPVIIDFYADWCGPCRMVAPVIDELSEEYKDEIDIYKVDTEDQKELAAMFGIKSIPSILFIPMDEQPKMATGAMPKENFRQAISEIFNIIK